MHPPARPKGVVKARGLPNDLAYAWILLWPLLAATALRRLPVATGIATAMFGAFLLLPPKTAIDLAFLPSYDKTLAGLLAALLLIAAKTAGHGHTQASSEADLLPGWFPTAFWARTCLIAAFAGTIATAALNTDPLVHGNRILPGLDWRDMLSALAGLLVLIAPFLVARRVFATQGAQRRLLVVFIASATIYCLPALYEIRMSPQLNREIFGFFPAAFEQHMRGGGFRPLVFLSHGLLLSVFLAMACLAALGGARAAPPERRPLYLAAASVLLMTLVLSKSLGALAVTLCLAPVVLLFPSGARRLVPGAIAVLLLAYPVLRSQDRIPLDLVRDVAHSVDAARAGSLQFRLDQEVQLLDKALERPIFGWGGWGRARIYDAHGRDVSVTDGAWIILLGQGGWVRYLSCFGLLCFPLLALARRRAPPPDDIAISLAFALAANLIDLLPNASLLPVTWLLAGALTGRLEADRLAVEKTAPAAEIEVAPLFCPPRQGLRIPEERSVRPESRPAFSPALPEPTREDPF